MAKYNDEYRIESVRLKDWDYTKPWWYYVTLCTKNHQEYFGRVDNEVMILNDLGKIVQTEWLRTKEIRENIELDYYVIMPNHFHGIIIINQFTTVETCRGKSHKEQNIEPCRSMALQPNREFSRPIKNSLSIIVNQFKGSVKRWANKNNYLNFSWQSRFYDRIIRNEKELYNIRNYILQNPLQWDLEKNIPENMEL